MKKKNDAKLSRTYGTRKVGIFYLYPDRPVVSFCFPVVVLRKRDSWHPKLECIKRQEVYNNTVKGTVNAREPMDGIPCIKRGVGWPKKQTNNP
mmetsp:Transcript_39579/g.40141  ORF Transcript_39579/g.40141 Transcript_39579/m.40141 type:complete len:93 (+) Transcript_39579:156-434(+)